MSKPSRRRTRTHTHNGVARKKICGGNRQQRDFCPVSGAALQLSSPFQPRVVFRLLSSPLRLPHNPDESGGPPAWLHDPERWQESGQFALRAQDINKENVQPIENNCRLGSGARIVAVAVLSSPAC